MELLKDEYPISYMSRLLDIKRSSYYKWVKKGSPVANNYNKEHARIIEEEHYRLEQVYGVDRLKNEILQKRNINMNHKKVRRYLRLLGLSCIVRIKKPMKYIPDQRKRNHMNMAPNLINNNFKSDASGKKLSTDVSYIKCTDGRLYLSAVKDLFNKEIIAYYVSDRNNENLIIKTIEQLPKGDGIIHSDQGSLYFDNKYIKFIKKLGYKRSMSRKGACWENSPIENWFSQIKEERLRIDGLMSKRQTKKAIKKYVRWYNNERIQKALNYLSPIKYSLCF